jgi:hypothetical protein
MAGMTTSANDVRPPMATAVQVTEDTLSVELSDGRTISVPVAWYPRLQHGSQEERRDWEILGSGTGIHWKSLDEDISVDALLAGKPSNESQASLKRWLSARGA